VPRQQQVGNVGARDQEHHEDGPGQGDEERRVSPTTTRRGVEPDSVIRDLARLEPAGEQRDAFLGRASPSPDRPLPDDLEEVEDRARRPSRRAAKGSRNPPASRRQEKRHCRTPPLGMSNHGQALRPA